MNDSSHHLSIPETIEYITQSKQYPAFLSTQNKLKYVFAVTINTLLFSRWDKSKKKKKGGDGVLMSPKKGDYTHLHRDGSSMVYAPQVGGGLIFII